MKIRRFQPGDVEPIARLNARLQAANVTDVVYPEGAEQSRAGTVRERLFVAEDDGEIRGGVWLKEQTFRIRGQDVVCGWLKYPVAESLIDSRVNSVPGSLLMQCLREQPRLMALGLGGHETPLARMLKALRWTGATVPMLVRVERPARCLRELTPLRRSAARRVVAQVGAASGMGWLAFRALDAWSAIKSPRPRDYAAQPVDTLGPWADAVWLQTRDRYDFLARRDAATVESLLPVTSDLQRLRVQHRGQDVGWTYVLRHDFSTGAPDRNFGRLTVGLIADGLAAPEHAYGVTTVALEFLRERGVDLVFSNQLHPAWTDSLRRLGFLSAPSNMGFYASPAASKLASDASQHINRGDCDGPMWYQGQLQAQS